jgi:hypothetical protein
MTIFHAKNEHEETKKRGIGASATHGMIFSAPMATTRY